LDPTLQASLEGPGVQSADISSGFQDYWEKVFGKPVDLNPPDYRALNTEQLFAQDAAKASMNSVPPGLEAEINSQYYGQNLGGDMGPGIQDAARNANTARYPLSPSSNLGPGGPYPGERFVPGGNLGPGGPYPGEPYVPGGQLGPTAEEYRNLAENTARYPSGGPTGPSPETEEFYRALNERSAAAPPSNVQHFDNIASTTQNMRGGNPAEMGYQPPQVSRGGYFNNGINGEYTDTLTPFERGMDTAGRYFDKTTDYIEKNPYKSAGLAYFGASKLGLLDPPKQEPIADNYKNPYTMTGFRRSSPSPSAYQYKPRYAQGGIASVQGYAKGGRSKAESAMDFYDAMNPQQEAPPLRHGDPGIYYDADPDTRYLDPMEAAMVRMSKLNSRTNVQAPTMAPSRRMGELDFKPVAAAQGGIMGYAGGGDVPIEENQFNKLTGRGGLPEKDTDPKSWANLSDADKAAHYRENPKLGAFNRVLYQGLKFAPVVGPLLNLQAMTNPEFVANQQAIWNGYDPAAFAEGPPDPNFNGQAAAAARQEGQIAAVNAANAAGAGLAANPMSTDPSQRGGGGGGGGGGASNSNPGDPGRGGGGAHLAQGGGIMGYNLGGYAAGGNPRLLRGPGDGMSDHIPATINNRQPARLADGEYVITADVVSHLGNGSTEAGAKQLDAMMKRVRKGRTGTSKQGKQINPSKYLPA
jgi:hypothetical protein